MFKGNKCPDCKKSIITFRRFIQVNNPGKTIECRHCGTSLKLSTFFSFIIIFAVLVGLAIPTFLIGIGQTPSFFNELDFYLKTIIGVFYLLLWIVGTLFLSWHLIGWKKA